MPDWKKRRKCLVCPYGGHVEAGVEHVRCDACRADHARGKAADAQWDRRARRRADREDQRRREGWAYVPDRQVRPRDRTPTWDRHGNEVDDTPRLTPTETRRLRLLLEELDRVVAQVRDALEPPR